MEITGSFVKDIISQEELRYAENIKNKLNFNSKDFFICIGIEEAIVLHEAMRCVDVAVGMAFSDEEIYEQIDRFPLLRKTKIYIDEQVYGSIFDKAYCNYSKKKHLQDCIKLLDNNGLFLIVDLPNKTCLNEFIKKNTKNKLIDKYWLFPNCKNNKRYDLLLKIKRIYK